MRLDRFDEVSMTNQVLQVVLYMIRHGFYQDQDDLNKIAKPIINILDGSNDSYRVNGKDTQLGVKRYFPNKNFDHSIQAKILACDILIQIARLETDQKCCLVISKIKHDIENSSKKSQKLFASYEQKPSLGRAGTNINLDDETSAHEAAKRHASNEFNQEFVKNVIEAKGFER